MDVILLRVKRAALFVEYFCSPWWAQAARALGKPSPQGVWMVDGQGPPCRSTTATV